MRFDIREYLDYERINLMKDFFIKIGVKTKGLLNPKDKKGAFDLLSVIMVFAGVIYVVVATMKGMNGELSFKAITTGFVMAYLIVNDIIEPLTSGELKSLSKEKYSSYIKYVIFDIVGFMALLYFALYAGEYRQVFHYLGIAIFVLLIKPKKESYSEFAKENV